MSLSYLSDGYLNDPAKKIWKLFLLVYLGAALFPSAAVSQAGETGTITDFEIDQTFLFDSNLTLQALNPVDTFTSTTRLSFSVEHEGDINRLTLDGSLAYRILTGPGLPQVENFFDDPQLRFSYRREVPSTLFSFSTNYRKAEIAYLSLLSDPIDGAGRLKLPVDFANLTGTGKRESYGLNTLLEIRRDAPLGVTLTYASEGLSYENPSNPELTDSFRQTLGAKFRANFSPASTGTFELRYVSFDNDNLMQTDTETAAFQFGLLHTLDQRTALDFAIGYTQVETEEGIGAARNTRLNSGLNGRALLSRELPNGSANIGATVNTDQDGTRWTAGVGRDIQLHRGDLSIDLDVTRKNQGDLQSLWAIRLLRGLPDGELILRATQRVAINASDDEEMQTGFLLELYKELTPFSGIRFSAGYVATDWDKTFTRTDRGAAYVTYRREITEDWDLNVGLRYRVKIDQVSNKADSSAVFINIGKKFHLQR